MLEIKNNTLPDELKEVILSGKCVAFIGSGLSAGSYDSWPDLINGLCERCGIDRRVNKNSPSTDFLYAAWDAKQNDSSAYFEYLGEHFGRLSQAQLLYDTILALPFACYLTVNFDPLLAHKARMAYIPCVLPVHAYPALDGKYVSVRSINYLHGFIDKNNPPIEGSIVLSKDEFDKAYDSSSPLMNMLIPTLTNNPILFIGCGLKEPSIDYVFRICKEQQLKRQRIMQELRGAHSLPPKKFIFQPIPNKIKNFQGRFSKQEDQESMNKKDKRFRGFEIEPVWYDAKEDHSILNRALDSLTNLPDFTPDYGW